MCADLFGHSQGLFVGNGLHFACAEGFCGRAIVPQVELGANEDNGNIGGVVFDFREPLIARYELVAGIQELPDMYPE